MSDPVAHPLARRARRAALAVGVALLIVVLVIGIEIALALRTEDLPAFERAELDTQSSEESAIRLAWIGDSTGVGVGASAVEETLPRRFVAGLARPVSLNVLAESGARVRDALTEQVGLLDEIEPDWVVVAIGNNDVTHLTRTGRFREDFADLLARVRAHAPDRLIVLGVGEFASTPLFAQPLRALLGARADHVNAIIAELAVQAGATFVDLIDRTGPEFVADPARYYARDRFHPSGAGYALWADASLDALPPDVATD